MQRSRSPYGGCPPTRGGPTTSQAQLVTIACLVIAAKVDGPDAVNDIRKFQVRRPDLVPPVVRWSDQVRMGEMKGCLNYYHSFTRHSLSAAQYIAQFSAPSCSLPGSHSVQVGALSYPVNCTAPVAASCRLHSCAPRTFLHFSTPPSSCKDRPICLRVSEGCAHRVTATILHDRRKRIEDQICRSQ